MAETKYPGTLVSSSQEKKLAYSEDVYDKTEDKHVSEVLADHKTALSQKYVKPSTGIPLADLAEDVSAAITNAGKADEVTLTKDATTSEMSVKDGGVTKTKLATAVQESLNKADSAMQSIAEKSVTEEMLEEDVQESLALADSSVQVSDSAVSTTPDTTVYTKGETDNAITNAVTTEKTRAQAVEASLSKTITEIVTPSATATTAASTTYDNTNNPELIGSNVQDALDNAATKTALEETNESITDLAQKVGDVTGYKKEYLSANVATKNGYKYFSASTSIVEGQAYILEITSDSDIKIDALTALTIGCGADGKNYYANLLTGAVENATILENSAKKISMLFVAIADAANNAYFINRAGDDTSIDCVAKVYKYSEGQLKQIDVNKASIEVLKKSVESLDEQVNLADIASKDINVTSGTMPPAVILDGQTIEAGTRITLTISGNDGIASDSNKFYFYDQTNGEFIDAPNWNTYNIPRTVILTKATSKIRVNQVTGLLADGTITAKIQIVGIVDEVDTLKTKVANLESLSTDVDNLKEDDYWVQENEIDVSSYEVKRGAIKVDGDWYSPASAYKHAEITIKGYSSIKVKGKGSYTVIAFLKSVPSAIPSGTPDYCDGTGRIAIADGVENVYVAPEDCVCLVVNTLFGNYDATPSELVILSHAERIANVESYGDRISVLEDDDSHVALALSSYYSTDSYIDNKITAINDYCEACSGNGDAFVFITDIHNGMNEMKSPNLLRYIKENTNIERLFDGGDDGQNTNVKTLANNAVKLLRKAWGDKVYHAVGNHETDAGATYNAINYWYNMANDGVGNPSKMYYYVDNTYNKVRYVILNSNILDDTEQQTWFANTALNVDEGWNVFIFGHYYGGWAYNEGETWPDGYPTYSENSTMKVYSDAIAALNNDSAKGNVIAIFQGHWHRDNVIKITSSNVPIIFCAADKNVATTNTSGGTDIHNDRTSGTIHEQSFDVVVADFTNKTLHLVRIGGLADTGTDGTLYQEWAEERTVTW